MTQQDFTRRGVLALVSALTIALSTPASAQPEPSEEEVAEARAIFAEGLAHSSEGEWHAAVTAFRQVLEVVQAAPVRYNLAVALVELGEYPEADMVLGQVLADESAPENIAEEARGLREELRAHAGTVAILVSGAPEGAPVFLLVDEFVLPDGQTEAHVREGDHQVSARVDGRLVGPVRVSISHGTRTELSLDASVEAAGGTEASPDVDPAAVAESTEGSATGASETDAGLDEPPTEERRLYRDWRLWAGVGGGVVAGVLTGVIIAVTDDPRAVVQGTTTPGVLEF